MGPAQPDQAVLAKADVAVQAPVGVETAAVVEACPVAAVQSAPRSDREGDRAGADVNRQRVGGLLVGLSRASLQGLILRYWVEVGSEDLGDEDHQRTADREQQLIDASCQQRGGGQRGGGRLDDHSQEQTAKDDADQQPDRQVPEGAVPGAPADPVQRQAQAGVFGGL